MFDCADPARFFLGGFESAMQRRRDGVRLDLLRATRHDRFAASDYRACRSLGLETLRDALRWPRIEKAAGRYDWSDWTMMLSAAAEAGVTVIWTLYHYGSPDHYDQRDADFPARFAEFAARAAEIHRQAVGAAPTFCAVNEISFFAWAVGVGYFPLAGPIDPDAFKRQLVRAAIAATRAVRGIEPGARFVGSEPLIHITPPNRERQAGRDAEAARLGQFEAYDMLTGRQAPELGGAPDLIDLIGLNFYPHNQWYNGGPTIPMGHHAYRPLADMVVEVWERYRTPLLFSETGCEGSAQPAWLHYVCDEARAAMARGVDLRGICLFPITHYPGWDDSRPVPTGLLSEADANGERQLNTRLCAELERQRSLFAGEV